MAPGARAGQHFDPTFGGLQGIDLHPIRVLSFLGFLAGGQRALLRVLSVRGVTIEKLLAIPVYFFYWVVGISTALTVILSYVNSNHYATFDNAFEFIISDPTAQKFYAARYAIVLVAFVTLVARNFLNARLEKRKWIAILSEKESASAIFDHIRTALNEHSGYISQDFKYQLNLELTRLGPPFHPWRVAATTDRKARQELSRKRGPAPHERRTARREAPRGRKIA